MKNKNNKTSVKKELSVKNLHVQEAIKNFFLQIGEDLNRDGIKETPKRFEEAIKYLLGGYERDFKKENKLFTNATNYNDIIILKNIDFFSLCEHHLLPFFGHANVGYVPGKKVLGISKLARAVDIYARRLQDQESLGAQIAESIMEHGEAKGVAVFIEAKHLCNAARGTEKKLSIMATCVYYGVFKKDYRLQQNFLELVRDREKI